MLSQKTKKSASLFYFRILILLIVLHAFTFSCLKAQCISNNEIQIAPLCIGNGLAVLKGSVPKGGSGNYSYAWERNPDGNCGNGGFSRIPGATTPDYIIPLGTLASACYRRIVISGNCRDESNKINVKPSDLPPVGITPQAPQASAQQPQSCSQPTGSITVTAVQGAQYSINGTQYQQSNVFTGVAPGTYSVTVKNSAGCVSPPTSVTINAAPSAPQAPQASAQQPQSCSQPTGSITVTAVPGAHYSINGTQYQQSNVFTGVAPGTYSVTVKNSAGCVSPPTSVTINAALSAPAGTIIPANVSICEGRSQVLAANGGTSYQWKRDGVDIPGATSSTYAATAPGTYSVTIKNGNCSVLALNSAVVRVQACIVIGESKMFVPEAFTPDRNNTNDVLRPYFKNVTELKYFKVFNRWGQMVFQTNVIGEGWDGTVKSLPQPSETYSWMLEYVDHNGKIARQSGTTVLVR